MSPEILQVIHARLNERCAEISHKPKLELETKGLTAWRDDLAFTPKGLENAGQIFDAAIEALRARFKFARLCHEMNHGPCEEFAAEFQVVSGIDDRNQWNGEFQVHAQFVLKAK